MLREDTEFVRGRDSAAAESYSHTKPHLAHRSPGSFGTSSFLWVIKLSVVFCQGGLVTLDFVVIAAALGPLLKFDLNKTHLAKFDFDWQLRYPPAPPRLPSPSVPVTPVRNYSRRGVRGRNTLLSGNHAVTGGRQLPVSLGPSPFGALCPASWWPPFVFCFWFYAVCPGHPHFCPLFYFIDNTFHMAARHWKPKQYIPTHWAHVSVYHTVVIAICNPNLMKSSTIRLFPFCPWNQMRLDTFKVLLMTFMTVIV